MQGLLREGECNTLKNRILSQALLFFFQGRFLWGLFTSTTTISPLPCCPGTSGCAKCGVEKTRRVIGGVETGAGVYPWIAALGYNGQLALGACSATLISSNWAVTAAHCIFRDPFLGPTTLVLGEHDLSNTNDVFDTNRQVDFYPLTFCPSGRRLQCLA